MFAKQLMHKLKNIITIWALLFFCLVQSNAKNNDLNYNEIYDSLVVVFKKYLNNRADKNKFIEDIEQFKITKQGYKQYLSSVNDSIHTNFYLVLAALANENGDWFEEKPIDFIKMGLQAAITENDSIISYEAIILSYFKKIAVELDDEKKQLKKAYLDKVVEELDAIETQSERNAIIQQGAYHNLAIIERLMGNYKKAEELLLPLTIESNRHAYNRASKIEEITNTINELGRVYLSEGIVNNDDRLIEKAIVRFDEAINILETENCSPFHLEELYQRKQKALFFLGKQDEALNLVNKLNNFSLDRCNEARIKRLPERQIVFYSITNDLPNIEITEENALSIKQKEILEENSTIKTYMLWAILAITTLLTFAALSWWKKKNELAEKNSKLLRTIAKLKILQFNASTVLDTVKDFDVKEGKLDFLNKYLVEIYNQFKNEMKEDSGFTAVIFDRKKEEILSKIIGIDKRGKVLNENVNIQKVDKKSIYYPFYEGTKELYIEQSFQNNYRNHNQLIDEVHFNEQNITTESIICVPLVFNKNEKPLGIISLQNDKKTFFEEDHIDLMKAIANMLTPVIAYFEIDVERNEIRQQKNRIIELLNHRFRNYIEINNTALQNIKHNLPKWNEEQLRERLISFGGDYQIYINTFKSFMRWLGLLGFDKSNFEGASTSLEKFDLSTVIKNEFEQLYFPLREHNIKYEILSSDDVTVQNIPKIYISEIIANLLINCIQHFMEVENDQQPKVTIDTNLNEKNLIISITDNGNGMPEHIKTNIFKNSINNDYEKSEGRGLGNMAIKYLVNNIEGKVRVAYSAKGKGTKVEILIPNKYVKAA